MRVKRNEYVKINGIQIDGIDTTDGKDHYIVVTSNDTVQYQSIDSGANPANIDNWEENNIALWPEIELVEEGKAIATNQNDSDIIKAALSDEQMSNEPRIETSIEEFELLTKKLYASYIRLRNSTVKESYIKGSMRYEKFYTFANALFDYRASIE